MKPKLHKPKEEKRDAYDFSKVSDLVTYIRSLSKEERRNLHTMSAYKVSKDLEELKESLEEEDDGTDKYMFKIEFLKACVAVNKILTVLVGVKS